MLIAWITANPDLSFITHGKTHTTYIHSALLYTSKCWTFKAAMICRKSDETTEAWSGGSVMSILIKEKVHSPCWKKLGIINLEILITSHKLRRYGLFQGSDSSIRQITNYEIAGPWEWSETVKEDIRKCNMTNVDSLERDARKNKLRTVSVSE